MNNRHGFVTVATAVPILRVANTNFNGGKHREVMQQAEEQGVKVLVFPELSLTGYTCKDLFHQQILRRGALKELDLVRVASFKFSGLAFVGLPLEINGQLYNCAAVISRGKVLGIVPKSYIPNGGEFEEYRWFRPASFIRSIKSVRVNGVKVPFGTDLLFECIDIDQPLVVGVELCEDLWTPIPPSCYQALAGANVLVNLSASNELIGKAPYRRELVTGQAARCMAAYLYTSSGVHESTTDVVFGGHAIISENGTIVIEGKRFYRGDQLLVAEVDIEKLQGERTRVNSFGESQIEQLHEFRRIEWKGRDLALRTSNKLSRFIDGKPFVPKGEANLRDRCEEIFNIQTAGLAGRMELLRREMGRDPKVAIGVSGGLDSTLALLVTCRTFDQLGIPRTQIKGITMPGFGTTKRTKKNAIDLMAQLGISAKEVDIRELCFIEMLRSGAKPFGIDLKGLTLEQFEEKLKDLPADAKDLDFENVQARMRTLVLMSEGFVIGTGTISELAKGWCTYNADHMSMYNVNVSVPKTLVKFLVRWLALNDHVDATQVTLLDIVATAFSPELLPTGRNGEAKQITENTVGPYELTDFYMYYLLRYGFTPEKILFLAQHAVFDGTYSTVELRHWLADFIVRFFRNQYKRSCLPDGSKTGSVSVSPRGDLRMPSDASSEIWLDWLTEEERKNPTLAAKLAAAAIAEGQLQTIMTTGLATAAAPHGCNLPDLPAYVNELVVAGDEAAGTTTAATTDGDEGKLALGIVDAINDFGDATHGDGQGYFASMAVPDGEKIGPKVGRLQEEGPHDVVFAGNDKHPADMFNLASQNPDKTPFVDQVADEDGQMVTVYPDHSIDGHWGAGFLPGVKPDKIDRIFYKGTTRTKDSYSACGNKDLVPWLKEQGVKRVDLCGLCFRICVGLTAIDLAEAGFKVRVVVEATRDLEIPAFQWVIDKMVALGIEFITVEKALAKS